MRGLSISAAWDETKAILARDGQLLITVAVALVALPTAVNALINPSGVNSTSTPWWIDLIAVIASLIALSGQLALIRLAIGPSVTVGAAIMHGLRRMPIYFVSVLTVVIGLVVVAVPLVMILSALGVPVGTKGVPPSPPTIIVGLFYLALVCFFGVRLVLSSPVASAEDRGPIGILARSWHLTSGYWWPLFGFVLVILIGAVVLLVAVGSALGVIIGLVFGAIEPMSAAALVLALVQSLVSAAITTLFAVMLARIYVQLAGDGEARASVPSSGI
jgi:hypothetical protein